MRAVLAGLALAAGTGRAANAPAGAPARPAVAELKVPVEIRGSRVRYMDKAGRAVFTGGVRVVRGTSTLTADSLQTLRGPNEAEAAGHVTFDDRTRQVALTCDAVRYANGLREIAARGACVLLIGNGDQSATVTSDRMELLVDAREAHAHGHVRIVQGDNEARSEEARLYGADDTMVLTGAPVLRRSPHEFVCVEARFDTRRDRTLLLGPVTGTLHANRLDRLRNGAP